MSSFPIWFGLAPRALSQRDADEVAAAVERVFAHPEFGREPTLIDRIIEWLSDLFSIDTDTERVVAEVFTWVVGISLVALIVLFVLQLARSARRVRGESDEDAARAGGDPRARALRLRHDAAAARAAGDLRLAMRLSFWALVVGLGARGDLTYRDAWTNRELLRRGRPPRALLALLEPLVDELEAKDFGSVPTTLADVERLESLCEQHLGSLAASAEGAAA